MTGAEHRSAAGVRPPYADADGEQPHGALTLFEISFASAMSDLDSALLARTLDLSGPMHPKARREIHGVARLDHYSGLFLDPGAAEGTWTLEARTWGHPAAQTVHEWQVLAAGAAHQLDATVTIPPRLSTGLSEIPDRPLGRAGNKRLARIRRRMVGLS